MRTLRSSRRNSLGGLLLAALITFSAPLYSQENPESASDYYESAIKFFNAEKYDEAVIELKNALQQNPRLLPALALLGQAYIRTGNPAAAESALTDAIASGADPSLLSVPLANAYISQLKYDLLLAQEIPRGLPQDILTELLAMRARSALTISNENALNEAMQRLKAIDENAVEYLDLEASIAQRYGQIDKAKKIVERMVKLYPSSEIAWVARASMSHLEGNYQRAISDYQRALELNPGNNSARLAKVGLLQDTGQHEAAKEDLHILMEQDEGDPRTRFLRSVNFAHAGDRHAARDELNTVINTIEILGADLVQRNEQLLLVAGIANYNLGNFEAARGYFEAYSQMGGAAPGPLRLLAKIYLDEDDYLSSARILEGLRNRVPLTIEMIFMLAEAYHGAGFHEKALFLMENVTSYPNTPDVLNTQLAISRIEAGYIERGITDLEGIFDRNQGDMRAGISLATTLINQGRYGQARKIAARMEQQDPNNPVLQNLLATASFGLGDLTQARKVLEKLLATEPDNSAAQINLAKIDSTEGLHIDARNRLQTLLEENPKNPILQRELAKSFAAEGDMKKALRYAREAAADAPDNLDTQKYLIALLLNQGHLDDAGALANDLEARFERNLDALEANVFVYQEQGERVKLKIHLERMAGLAGSNSEWLAKIAFYQQQADALEDAAYTLFKAVQANPDSAKLQAQLCEVELNLNRLEEAESRARELIKNFPDNFLGHALLGDFYMKTGKFDDAIKHYSDSFRISPDSRSIVRLALGQRSAGKWSKAETTLLNWLDSYEADDIVRQALAETFLLQSDYARAHREYVTLTTAMPKHAPHRNNLAYTLFKLNKLPEALEQAKMAHKIQPEDPAINDTLGWLLVNSGDYEESIKYLREALTRNSTNAEIRYHLAEALYGLGRLDEARKELVLSLESNSPFEGVDQAEKLLQTLQN